MRHLRYTISGWLMAGAIRMMPRGKQRTTLVDALDLWIEKVLREFDVSSADNITIRIHQKFR